MDKLAVTGDSVLLEPPPGCVWQGWDGKLRIEGLQSMRRITADGQPVVLEADLPMAALLAAGKPYISPPFVTPGVIGTVQLTVIPPTLSMSVALNGQKLVTAGTQGTYTMVVASPAMQPSAPSPIPDPLLSKVGKWSIVATTQSSASSGMPMPAPKPGADGAEGAGAGGAGSGGSSGAESEQQDHYVAVTIEDTDGNKFAKQFAFITLPTGERVKRQLSSSGGARVDGIQREGDGLALVNLVFDPALAPVVDDSEQGSFIALEVVDEDGNPLALHEVSITLEGAEPIVATLNDKGRARVDGVTANVSADVKLRDEPPGATAGEPPSPDDGTTGAGGAEVGEAADESSADGGGGQPSGDTGAPEAGSDPAIETRIVVADGSGQPLAQERVLVRRADGIEEEALTDDAGTLLLASGAGEALEVSFPDRAADDVAVAQEG